jgi:hypothetical protein
MGFSREHVLIGLPTITEGVAVFVLMRNGIPETQAGRFAAVTDDEGHNLPRSATHRCPQPAFLLFLLHKAPDAHPIRAPHLVSQASYVSLTSGKFWT